MATVGHDAGVAVISVDATKHAAVDSNHVVHDDVARAAVVGAVAAASHHLTVIIGVEVLDLDCAPSIKLDNLIRGFECTSTIDVGSATGLLERTVQ